MDELLKGFDFDASAPSPVRTASKLFQDLARKLVSTLPACTELVAALRRLLEARDLAVRAAAQLPAAEGSTR